MRVDACVACDRARDGRIERDGCCVTVIRLRRIYNFLLLHAILSTVLDYIGLYYPLLFYFWD